MKSKDKLTFYIKNSYSQLVENIKQLILSIGDESLRGILERQDEPNATNGYIVHELINPLLYLRLECLEGNIYTIHYGYEQSELSSKYYPITSAFIRSVYRYTSKENTEIDIEDSIHTDWVVTNCAELFEYISDRNKFHHFETQSYHDKSIAA